MAAAACAVVATGTVLAPLLGRPAPLPPGRTAALVGTYVAVAAAVTLTLTPAGFVGFANWWPGGLAPLLAALVLRHRARAALVAAVGGTAALAAGAVLTQVPGERLGSLLALAFPLAVWPLGALAVRASLDRADAAVTELRSGAARTLARARRGDAVDAAAAQVLDLAVPLLRDRAAGRTPSPDDEGRARQVEKAVRDELRGGRLLDAPARAGAGSLRAAGWDVAIDDHSAHDLAVVEEAVPALVRDLVHLAMRTCADSPGPGRLELTAPADRVTLLTVLAEAPGAVLDALVSGAEDLVAAAAPRWWVEVERDESPDAALPGSDGLHHQIWIGLCRRDGPVDGHDAP